MQARALLKKLILTGCCIFDTAENIPEEPDADNADVGSAHELFRVQYSIFDPRIFRGFSYWSVFLDVRISAVPERKIQKMKQRTKINLYALCEAAIMVALATVFSLLRFPPFRIDLWAQGGSIDFVMVPIIILGWRRGARWAIPAGLALGLIECLIAGGIGWGLPSVLLDYVLAYGAVGVAGFFRNEKWGLAAGAAVASLARFCIHFVSGVTIYKIAVGESVGIFGMTFGDNMSYLYSLVYNGSYMLGNMIIALLIVFILRAPLKKLPK